jgi:hypothetical protein
MTLNYVVLMFDYRWLEWAAVYHATVRLLFCCACALRWMTYPVSYVAPVKMGIDTFVDVLLETPSQGVSDAKSTSRGSWCTPCMSSIQGPQMCY